MAWVRIDDQAPRHEKMLRAGCAACWFWVCGIAHAQSQLTDGFISEAALPMLGATRDAKKLAEKLVEVGLFDRVDGGYRVHDYLHHNPSRSDVLAKRAVDAERKRTAESGGTPRGIHAESGAPRARVPSHPIPSEPNRPSSTVSPLTPRPRNFGRIDLHRWQTDALIAMLGSLAEDFRLDEWVFGLSKLADERKLILDKRTLWPWVQAELRAECERRGLTVAGEQTTSESERLAKMQATIAAMDREAGVRR